MTTELQSAIANVPNGRWAVGVSGGADSVALLRLLHARGDLELHVVHLDHQLRGAESDADARFVAGLANELKLTSTFATRAEIEPTLDNPPANLESRGRTMRLALFARVAREHKLDGVILAHHADDVAETILMRLARGSLWWTLRGIEPATQIAQLLLLRPILNIRRDALRNYLNEIGQTWREDASNASPQFARNRARKLLNQNPSLFAPSLQLARDCDHLCDWIDSVAPALPDVFAVHELADRPAVIARLSAMRWLLSQGCPPVECSTMVIDRLIEMSRDAATASRQSFPGKLEVRRRGGVISPKVA